MSDWAGKLAHELKRRDNPPILGAILGTVITPPPELKISILEGQVYITKCYVLDYVLEGYQRVVSMPLESTTGEITMKEYEINREDGGLLVSKDYKMNEFELKDKKIVTRDTLKADDEVLLITSQDNQTYFLVGKVQKIGE